MGIAHLRKWDVTAIEIALDLEMLRFSEPARLVFSGPAEPRICLVAAFASTSQLKRIVAAVDRVMPARLPPGLLVAPPLARSERSAPSGPITIQPMPALLRLQSRLIRAIEPGLTDSRTPISFANVRDLSEAAARFIRDFIPCKTLPSFEPAHAAGAAIDLSVIGITIYRLGTRGAPESILAHWAYARGSRSSLHLESGP